MFDPCVEASGPFTAQNWAQKEWTLIFDRGLSLLTPLSKGSKVIASIFPERFSHVVPRSNLIQCLDKENIYKFMKLSMHSLTRLPGICPLASRSRCKVANPGINRGIQPSAGCSVRNNKWRIAATTKVSLNLDSPEEEWTDFEKEYVQDLRERFNRADLDG